MYWYRREGGLTNFGDELGPEIVRRLGFEVRYVPAHKADLVACGSIMHHLASRETMVWGSGMMSPPKRPKFRLKHVLAVRGTETAERIPHEGVALGDPGLLVPLLWKPARKRHKLGVVPHYVDTRSYPEADIVIDVEAPLDQVIEDITSCERIKASSLHGYIVARAFGIPAERIAHPRVGGGSFKWNDFESVMDRPLNEIQQDLLRAFPS